MGKIPYSICIANEEQRANIIKNPKWESAAIYVAVDESGRIIGYIVVREEPVPLPLDGKYCWIMNLRVDPDFRRMGIATALVNEIKKQAELSDLMYLYGSADPTLEASMFWLKQGFSLNAYAKKQEDKNEPLKYGNYPHLMSYRVKRTVTPEILSGSHCIRPVQKQEINQLVRQYLETSTMSEISKEFFMSKIEEFFGFVAIGEENNIIGHILAYADEMKAPIDGNRWFLKLFVAPAYRRRGIGFALTKAMIQYAKGKDVMQLTTTESHEGDIGFWYRIGFDIFFWGVNANTGKRSSTAMLRINDELL